MPQVDLKYSNNVPIDCDQLFKAIEKTILSIDSSAGACKCRSYPCENYLHRHVFLSIKLLRKPHRNDVFMTDLLQQLYAVVSQALPKNITLSVEADFISSFYITKTPTVDD